MNKYTLLIVTPLPVKIVNDDLYALDLWCKDIDVNLKYIKKLGIICPKSEKINGSLEKIPTSIDVHIMDNLLTLKTMANIMDKYDVIQLSGGRPFWQCYKDFYILFYAKKAKKKVIFSISSNRVKLTLLNSEGKNKLKQFKARIVSRSIYYTQKFFNRYADGVMLVGESLKITLGITNNNTHINLASWINKDDIISKQEQRDKFTGLSQTFVPQLCVCTRLERMKGVHLAIEVLAELRNKYGLTAMLSIYGEGPELDNLKQQVDELQLLEQVKFLGVVAYGSDFFNEIRKYELMLLTNLSDEQPRLIFDAISQGVIPVCPNTMPYKNAGLNENILYQKGDAVDIARLIHMFTNKNYLVENIKSLLTLLDNSTIDAMHIKRVQWVKGLL
jgi:glycosyltransferase involved in cell wall biosynthesis